MRRKQPHRTSSITRQASPAAAGFNLNHEMRRTGFKFQVTHSLRHVSNLNFHRYCRSGSTNERTVLGSALTRAESRARRRSLCARAYPETERANVAKNMAALFYSPVPCPRGRDRFEQWALCPARERAGVGLQRGGGFAVLLHRVAFASLPGACCMARWACETADDALTRLLVQSNKQLALAQTKLRKMEVDGRCGQQDGPGLGGPPKSSALGRWVWARVALVRRPRPMNWSASANEMIPGSVASGHVWTGQLGAINADHDAPCPINPIARLL